MLIIFFRAVVLFSILLVVIRLMGKRQIGEMEPFELVITLVIAELACIPMSDRSIPLTYGIVSILTMFVIHQFILLLSRSSKMQSLISGKPVMVINRQGVIPYALNQLNIQVNDILQSIRSAGYFSIEEIDYGIMETNGQLSVVPNKEQSAKQQTLPVPVILDGKWDDDDIERNGIHKDTIMSELSKRKIKVSQILFLTIDENGRMVFQTKKQPKDAVNIPKKVITK
ncbi:MAG: DUF421 domain-containing protein [Clostridia bacterium]